MGFVRTRLSALRKFALTLQSTNIYDRLWLCLCRFIS